MRLYFIILISFCFFACVETPTPPKNNIGDLSEHGAYILCEGLYGQNNSSLSRYDFEGKITYNDFFQTINNQYIGDTANDLVLKGDTAFIVVSTQKKIILFNTKTGKLISEIIINEGKYPRKMAILNDSILFVTDLYCHCFWVVNHKNYYIFHKVATGPAPEGTAITEDYIFIANSGLGDYLSLEPMAGTIIVYDISNMNRIKLMYNLPNVIQLRLSDKNGKLYARYNQLPKFKDSLGGIVEYDIHSLLETRRWIDRAGQFVLSATGDSLFYLSDYGLKLVNLNNEEPIPELLIPKNKITDYWYSIAVYKDELWIGNAKDYQSNGEILIYDINNPQNLVEKFNVGLNPNTIVFF